MKFTLLGSGAVRPDLQRWGPGQVVEVGGTPLLFDCGRGVSMRLVQAGIGLETICHVFFTHHHYDHNCDFAYLFLTGWVLGRDEPMNVIGPRGTEAFCDALLAGAYRDDIASRRGHPQYSEHGCEYTVRDVPEDEWTFTGEGYTLRAIHVPHVPNALDNLAFRVDAGGKSVVIVGDTTDCPALEEFAAGVDLLVHECTFPTERIESGRWGAFHISPKALGAWARRRGVKRLLLKHFAVQEGVTVDAMAEEVRGEFGDDGLIVGCDLLELEI